MTVVLVAVVIAEAAAAAATTTTTVVVDIKFKIQQMTQNMLKMSVLYLCFEHYYCRV